MSFFEAAFSAVVGEEGGYSNDSQDPGGETKFGVSKKAYPDLDIANLTLQQAQDIYLKDYWNVLGCDACTWEIALVMFDCGVNMGVSLAKRLHATTANAAEFQAERALLYMGYSHADRYGRGWMRRLFNVYKLAQVTPK